MARKSATDYRCYLRPGEARLLRGEEGLVAMGPEAPHIALGLAPCVRKEQTKTNADDETLLLNDSRTVGLGEQLQAQAEKVGGENPLFDFSAQKYSQELRRVCAILEADHLALVPHLYRHGGITRDLVQKLRGQIERRKRARRASYDMLVRYGKPGRRQQMLSKFPPSTRACGEYCRENLRYLLQSSVPALTKLEA